MAYILGSMGGHLGSGVVHGELVYILRRLHGPRWFTATVWWVFSGKGEWRVDERTGDGLYLKDDSLHPQRRNLKKPDHYCFFPFLPKGHFYPHGMSNLQSCKYVKLVLCFVVLLSTL